MKKFKDFLGNEITDPWCLNILQRLDELKKRNRGRKYFSEEDKKELDAISEEQDKHWEILKKEIDKIPLSELVKLFAAIEKVNHNSSRFWDEIIKVVNKIAEDNNLNIRYTSLFELHKISIDSRKSLNKLNEEVLKEKKKS
jgi:hypothetical protein